MGFTTGFLGGLTLTYSVLYLTIYLHKANRNVQQTLLKQSHTLLNSVIEPLPPPPEPPVYELKKAGLAEMLKDRWNAEIEKLVHNVQTTDWVKKREEAEERIANVWGNVRETERGQEVERRFKENVVGEGQPDRTEEVKANLRENLKDAREIFSEKVKDAKENVKEGLGLKDVGGVVLKGEVKPAVRQKTLLEL